MANTSLRETIVSVINKVRTDSGRDSLSPKDEDALMSEIGLDSLDLAQLVAELEGVLGIDPFRSGGKTARTLGDLVAVYQEEMDQSE